MEEPNSVSGDATTDATSDSVADANSMAYAAAEAAASLSASEAREDLANRTCRICSKGGEDGRAMIHFPPIELDPAVSAVAPQVTTFTEDLVMHVFCGKTASILHSMPQYEILSKAGLKNKHGIGTDVNTALARTRCATVTQLGLKEKQFYIVQEYEANLTAVRLASGSFSYPGQVPQSPEMTLSPHAHLAYAQPPLVPDQQYTHPPEASTAALKPAPVRAAAGTTYQKPGKRKNDAASSFVQPSAQQEQLNLTADGTKVKCACGGTHLPSSSPRGAASWRTHVLTKRHQKWMEQNGMLGAV